MARATPSPALRDDIHWIRTLSTYRDPTVGVAEPAIIPALIKATD